MLQRIGIALIGIIFSLGAVASGSPLKLKHVDLDQKNHESLQRGAKYFMNYCSGCHSLRYMRYKALAEGLQIYDENGQVDEKLVQKSFIFPDHKIGDLMTIAMPPKDATSWFGKAPPDLTLEARVRGSDWIYNFLTGFYYSPEAPRNVNNTVFPDVAMPHVLQGLEGIKVPIFEEHDAGKIVKYTQLVRPGLMSEQEYQSFVYDITNFLTYVAEPMKLTSAVIGWFALAFLLVFTVLAYLMKKAFWEDVH